MTREGSAREPDRLRSTQMEAGWAPHAEGSCLIHTGRTRVLCTASVEEEVPAWREGSGAGWVTAEYAMLPRSTHTRRSRERERVSGRTREIQRLIGRSLRAATDLGVLGARTVIVDCDVLLADGGTRTASVTGGCVALALACRGLLRKGAVSADPLRRMVAGVSVGLVDDAPVLDLDYASDRDARVDLNVVADEEGRLVEIQGTAEGRPFAREELGRLVDLALQGTARLVEEQRRALEGADSGSEREEPT